MHIYIISNDSILFLISITYCYKILVDLLNIFQIPTFFFSKLLFFIVGILSSVCVYVGRCLLSLKYIFAWKRSKFRCTVNPLFGGRWEEGSGWGTHVYLWQIHFAYVFNSDGSLCIQFVFTENNKAKNIYVGSV